MRHCPVCGSDLKAGKCTGCDYVATKPKANDANWWRCADTDTEGNRCSKTGSLSQTTLGGGPWYCDQHFPPFRGRKKGTPPPGRLRAYARPASEIAEDLAERAAIEQEPEWKRATDSPLDRASPE